MTGEKAKFVIELPRHTLSFNTKLKERVVEEEMDASEANLPSEASIDLPKVQVSAEYIQDDPSGAAAAAANPATNPNSSTAANVGSPTTFRGGLPMAPGLDGSILSQGSIYTCHIFCKGAISKADVIRESSCTKVPNADKYEGVHNVKFWETSCVTGPFLAGFVPERGGGDRGA